jgi:hypothetical protein
MHVDFDAGLLMPYLLPDTLKLNAERKYKSSQCIMLLIIAGLGIVQRETQGRSGQTRPPHMED